MVNKERVALLVAALRSGKYKQGREYLGLIGNNVTHCCLGVACEVAIENGLGIPTTRIDGYVMFDGAESVLPASVRDWYGFDSADPFLKLSLDRFYNVKRATVMNDSRRYRFDVIAIAFEQTFLS